jgi:8-oxo-dGTP pyrophosphatase MutT (NUDIX family)
MATIETIRQAAALPIHNNRVCLVTTSSGQGVIIPKGNIPDGMDPSKIAECEAWEEAGLLGRIGRQPIGNYFFLKSGKELTVQVYLLEVKERASSWPEQHYRKRIWCSPQTAAERVSHIGLRELIEQFVESHSVIASRK